MSAKVYQNILPKHIRDEGMHKSAPGVRTVEEETETRFNSYVSRLLRRDEETARLLRVEEKDREEDLG